MTDHGVLYGAIEFYKEATRARHQADHRHRGLRRAGLAATTATPGDKQPYHLTLLAKNETGYRNLLTLVHEGPPRGLLLQAAHGPRAARAAPRGHHRPLRLPLRRVCTATSSTAASTRRVKAARWYRERLRRTTTSSSRSTACTRVHEPLKQRSRPTSRKETRHPGRRHERLALRHARGRTTATTSCSASAPTPPSASRTACKMDGDAGYYAQVRGRDARALPRAARGGRQHLADRRDVRPRRSSSAALHLPDAGRPRRA